MRQPSRAIPVLALLALGGCAATPGPTTEGGAIPVTASDSTCEVARATAPAGTVQFAVTNTGSKVNEFYVYAEGDRIVGEVENIGPGLSRTFLVELRQPGTYQTACKPGMVGDGIRSTFTVTGESVAAGTTNDLLAQAVSDYERYAKAQSAAFLDRTTEFVALVKAGKVEQAKALYPVARSYWERIEPVAESFGDLDPKIDGREDVLEEGMAFTGYHRIEKDLWVDGLQKDTGTLADQLLSDVTTLNAKIATISLNPLQLANGSKALLDEIATGKITGEEERYSHTDLWDFEANFEGSRTAIAALRPYLMTKDKALVETIDARAKALGSLLESHRKGDGFVLYTQLSKDEVRALSDALDAFSEPASKIAALVAAA